MPQSNAVEIAGLDHINIQTPVVEETCVFFEKIVGLKRGYFARNFRFPAPGSISAKRLLSTSSA